MHIDFDLTKLREMTRLRSIRIDGKGNVDVHSLSDEAIHGGLSLDVHVDPVFLAPISQCLQFEATSMKFVVPLSFDLAGPLIDPERWGEFSDIKTSNAKKHRIGGTGDWTGTIEERVRVKFGPVVTDYHNRLKINFNISALESHVEFELDECFQGDLAFEQGYFKVEPHPVLPFVTLECKKALLYKPPSPWCKLPEPVLTQILKGWLAAATAEYALRMAMSGASGLFDDALRTLPHIGPR